MKFTRWTLLTLMVLTVVLALNFTRVTDDTAMLGIFFLSIFLMEVARIDGYLQGVDRGKEMK